VVTCADEGPVAPTAVADVCGELMNLGCFEVSLGDETAAGDPTAWRAMWEHCAARVSPDRLAVRLRSDALAPFHCLDTLLPLGLQTVDTAVGGLGPDRLLGTEDVVAHLDAHDIASNVNQDLLVETAWWFGGHLGEAPSSRVARNHDHPSPG
jgi:hydroxymethylglutaryl-CoA lyase